MNSIKAINTSHRLSLITRTRRNHGLEHATINVINERHPGLRVGGYSTPFGFHVIGPITHDILTRAINEALLRISSGSRGLVIHERCGTNFVAGGLLAGLAAWLGMLGVKPNKRSQLERLPLVILLSTLALMYSPRMGAWLQENVTTTSQMQGLKIVSITSGKFGGLPRFTVHTENE
jgi:uncharacterized protein YqhQ